MRIEKSICPLTMLVKRSMLTVRIERSICPLTMLVETASYNAYPESVSHTMLVERSILTMRIERSICPLSMLVERSMLTMRIERSISPLTMLVERSMVRRRHDGASSSTSATSCAHCARRVHTRCRRREMSTEASCGGSRQLGSRGARVARAAKKGNSAEHVSGGREHVLHISPSCT